MDNIVFDCKNCGASLTVPENAIAVKCKYCKSQHKLACNDGVITAELVHKVTVHEKRIDNLELRYERVHSSRLLGLVSLYLQRLDAIGHNTKLKRTISVGEQRQGDVELELSYQGERFKMGLSHQYTKLIDFRLSPGVTATFVTAEPNGFGDDLSEWSPHISKLNASY